MTRPQTTLPCHTPVGVGVRLGVVHMPTLRRFPSLANDSAVVAMISPIMMRPDAVLVLVRRLLLDDGDVAGIATS